METKKIITATDIVKVFKVGAQDVQVLKSVTLEVDDGDFMIIFGPSGCGKSTLLHIILGLEAPTAGKVIFSGSDMYTSTTEDDRSTIRKQLVGMVYQQPNWIKSLKVAENVGFPLMLLGREKTEAQQKAFEVLKSVSMQDWADYYPTELSSGQQQRIALARSLINDPKIIIADEPTGNLDYESGQEMMQLLYDVNKNQGKTIIMVTHDLEYMKFAKTAVRMLDGQIIEKLHGDQKSKLTGGLKSKRLKISLRDKNSVTNLPEQAKPKDSNSTITR